MAYNKYNTRQSGRWNTPGQFVSAGELAPGAKLHVQPQRFQHWRKMPQQPQAFTPTPRKQQPQVFQPATPPPQPPQSTSPQMEQDDDIDMKAEATDGAEQGSASTRPFWMKTKLSGVKKISNKERRRRQNETLRRLLTPKNALMVLNEMMPNEQVANQFKVEPATSSQYYKPSTTHSFCADLTLDGNNYKGYGENKLMARNAAAEQAIRDLIIKRLSKINSDGGSQNGDVTDEESLPMIQLASFALHKLFSEWEYEGHKVPQLKPPSASISGGESTECLPTPGPKPKAAKLVPSNAAAMHPCMLLTYLRPHMEYRELAAHGDRPQNMIFTMAVDVDGQTYIGKASNKKEARKQAAKAACEALFDVHFDSAPSANAPVAQ